MAPILAVLLEVARFAGPEIATLRHRGESGSCRPSPGSTVPAPLPYSISDDPGWSPDGKAILFSTNRGNHPEMWVMKANGDDQLRIAYNTAGPLPGDAAWQPVP
jgi:hypothetical protein